jgi:hypothetical protein
MDKKSDNSYSEKALRTLWFLILAGALGIVLFALQVSNWREFFSATAIGLMLAGASLLIGGFLGFLFGIPRTLQQERPVTLTSNTAEPRAENTDQSVNYQANTNLEQISDWLTKILVGVGLTQINKIPTALQQVSQSISVGIGGTNMTPVFVLPTILFFLICGFLFGYLWTRLFLPGAFRQADLSTLINQVKEARTEAKQATNKVSEFEKQRELDAKALILVLQQLNPSKDIPAPTQEQLNEAIKAASQPVRVQIFNQAQNLRSENWQKDKEKMALTVPLFRALIECDTDGRYHRNHAQLGYALKDQMKPDFAVAEAELTRAIELRGSWQDNGWLFYEFNRALCRIKGDEGFRAGQASKPDVREKILSDLHAAAQDDYIIKVLLEDPDIRKWMSQNSVTRKDLK